MDKGASFSLGIWTPTRRYLNPGLKSTHPGWAGVAQTFLSVRVGRAPLHVKTKDFSFIISSILILHLKPFAIAPAHRLESGLVRLVGRGTSALSKRRVENFLDDVKMTNEK